MKPTMKSSLKATSLLALACAIVTLPCFAQQESLLLGAGDKVHVEVFDTPELNSTARVTDNGDLPLMMGGSAHVAGLTPQQASAVIEQNLVHRKLMNTPQVLVTVEKSATQNVTVFGQVVHPSAYEISTPRPLTELLAQAGGFTESADHHVTIRRSNQKLTETIFVSNDPKTDLAQNVYIYPGDSITVPKQGLVYVLGDVVRAGGFPMDNDMSGLTVLQAISIAGGTAHTAKAGHAKLLRRENGDNYKEIPLNLDAMAKGKQPDIHMAQNDIIYVPFGFIKNAALGITGVAAAATSAVIYAK
jgi:polysaccharide export outer membrane protein